MGATTNITANISSSGASSPSFPHWHVPSSVLVRRLRSSGALFTGGPACRRGLRFLIRADLCSPSGKWALPSPPISVLRVSPSLEGRLLSSPLSLPSLHAPPPRSSLSVALRLSDSHTPGCWSHVLREGRAMFLSVACDSSLRRYPVSSNKKRGGLPTAPNRCNTRTGLEMPLRIGGLQGGRALTPPFFSPLLCT